MLAGRRGRESVAAPLGHVKCPAAPLLDWWHRDASVRFRVKQNIVSGCFI